MPEDVVLAARLTDREAHVLALFLKRLSWAEMRACAVDDDECYEIRGAVQIIRDGLADAGHAPR